MTKTEQLNRNELVIGHLVAAISLGLMSDVRDSVDDILHPRESTGAGILAALIQSTEDFIDEH